MVPLQRKLELGDGHAVDDAHVAEDLYISSRRKSAGRFQMLLYLHNRRNRGLPILAAVALPLLALPRCAPRGTHVSVGVNGCETQRVARRCKSVHEAEGVLHVGCGFRHHEIRPTGDGLVHEIVLHLVHRGLEIPLEAIAESPQTVGSGQPKRARPRQACFPEDATVHDEGPWRHLDAAAIDRVRLARGRGPEDEKATPHALRGLAAQH
mmetsp:Transcript_56807/g.158175  ORF Transcript_56807/g.158175 Transcript_56807/m.158175 type:complete len:209 (+) Transcript_56807:1394-2020(+)